MIEEKDKWGQPLDRSFVTILIKDAYGIWDKVTNQYVKTWSSNKCVWSQAGHAKNAFYSATGITIDKQTRYEVIKIQ